MGKYKRYKNRTEMFLTSGKGKRLLNLVYSWGASVIVIGTMFKILHLPYANWIIGIALSVEALVFFIFGFEKPMDEYHWEDVFPVLKSKNPMDRRAFSGYPGIVRESAGDVCKYPEQLSGMSGDMECFCRTTDSLAEASDDIQQNSQGYIRQMEVLNRNIAGLNAIYEIQLKSISSQIESIEHINSGLTRIKEMFDGSVTDSLVFRNETEKMTRQLVELNQVYERLLQAMTINMSGNDSTNPVK